MKFEQTIAGKTYSEILSMRATTRCRWCKTLVQSDKEKVMKIVEFNRRLRMRAWWTPERKERMSVAATERWKDPDFRIKMVGKNHSMYGRTGEKHPMYGKSCPEHSERMMGENNPNFKNWSSKKPYCENWTEDVREYIRNLYNRICVVCGKSMLQNISKNGKWIGRLDVDHTDENKMQGCDNWKWRLTPLCHSCHGKMQKQKFPWHLLLHLLLINNKKHQINFLFGDEIQ